MSLTYQKSSLMQISPKIWIEGGRLYARTSIWYLLACLFFYSRTVIVDKGKRHIKICIKYFWFIKLKTYIHFNDIQFIDQIKRGIGESYGITKNGFEEHDITEIYYVQVRTKSSPIPVNLFRFIGSGAKTTGWVGVLFGDTINDYEGMQCEHATYYAHLVSKFTGVLLWGNRNVEYTLKPVSRYKCKKCNHIYSAEIAKCIYCGHDNIEVVNKANK